MQRLIHKLGFAMCIVTLSAVATSARGQAPLDFPPVSDNAALQYWQGFCMLPALDADQEKLLENWETAPIDDAANKLLDSAQTSLMYMRRAAKMQKCDWGLDYHDGVFLYLPHLAKARTLARIAALDARRAFEKGQLDVARDNAFGMMAMARHVGTDATLVSFLVDYAIENMTVSLVAPYVHNIKASYDDAVAGFNALPPKPRLDQTLRGERWMTEAVAVQLQDAEKKKPGGWRDLWLSLAAPDVPEVIKNVKTLDEALKLVDEFRSVHDELASLVMLPPAEFDAKFPQFVERQKATKPMAVLLLPAMDKVMAAQRRGEARMAMLLAGIAVAEGGEAKLAEIKDPFGDGPFGYRKLEEGFELSSKLVHEGKPVTLAIGQKPKK